MTSGYVWDPARPEGNGWVEPPDPETTLLATTSAADILAAGGIVRAPEVVEFAEAAGLDLAAAATMLQKESGGGQNIWGHDNVPTAGTYAHGGEVTQADYLAYRQAVIAGRAGRQGVGPTQITWRGYQDQADGLGGCWDWRCNITVGFQALAAHIRTSGLRDGFRDYNGSGPAAEAYADEAMALYREWCTRLGSPGPEPHMPPPPLTAGQVDEMHQQLLGLYDAWPGGMTDKAGTPYDLLQFALRQNVTGTQTYQLLDQFRREMLTPANRQLQEADVNRLAATFAAHPTVAAALAPKDDMEQASFWAQTGERSLKAIAQSLLSMGLTSGVLNLFSVDWKVMAGTALASGVFSVLTSVVSARIGDDSPSLAKKRKKGSA